MIHQWIWRLSDFLTHPIPIYLAGIGLFPLVRCFDGHCHHLLCFPQVGSRAKGTQVASSDLDLKVVGPRPLTERDRDALFDALARRFHNIRQTPNIHKVGGNWGPQGSDLAQCGPKL